MKRLSALAVVAAALITTPLLAGQPAAKRPMCQPLKPPLRDAKRLELCRKALIPPVVDPTPMFLVSTTGPQAALSDLS
ncbi:MAG: hypothetical protein M3Q88_06715 [Pseudomonadota bacterium]|nr:hypothetical protein [Pseudomonadota bacterium]